MEKPRTNTWTTDLKDGEVFEEVVQQWLQARYNRNGVGCWWTKTEGYYPDFDLFCDHCWPMMTIECKLQRPIKNFIFEQLHLDESKAKIFMIGIDSGFGLEPLIHAFKFDQLKAHLQRLQDINSIKLQKEPDGHLVYSVPMYKVKDRGFYKAFSLHNRFDLLAWYRQN